MAVRYESHDEEPPEERNRAAQERHAMWESLAAEVIATDPAFHRWRNRHWAFFGCLAGFLFVAVMWLAITTYDKAHPAPRAFAAPFVVASMTLGLGYWIYSARIRKIALEQWSKQRARERGEKNA